MSLVSLSALPVRRISSPAKRIILALLIAVWACLGTLQAQTSTSLALTSSGIPVTSMQSGQVLTLSATVLNGAAAVTRGQVDFCDATAAYCTDVHVLGTAQLTSAGTAVLRLTPGIGTHSYQAKFKGTQSVAANSSSVAALTVNGLAPTVTNITSSGGVGNYSLTATVTGTRSALPAPGGTVSFLDLTNGSASLGTAALGAGATPVFGLTTAAASPLSGIEIATGDFNGDGFADIANFDAVGNVIVGLGNGDGTFHELAPQPLLTFTYYLGAIVADFNQDGIADLAVIGSDSNVAILLGNGDGSFSAAAKPPVGYAPSDIVSADFNGDGIADLAVACEGTDSVYILLGVGDGTFTAVSAVSATGSTPAHVVTADLNGDGKPDLVVSTIGRTSSITTFSGNGDGTFTAVPASTFFYSGASGFNGPIAVADFNGDGKPDLATAVADSINVYAGNGDGTFRYPDLLTFISTVIAPNLIVVKDFNADGVADIGAVSAGNSSFPIAGPAILLGKGGGSFTLSGPFAGTSSGALVSADFDSDGVPDLAYAAGLRGSQNTLVSLSSNSQSASATINNVSLPGTDDQQVVATYSGDGNFSMSQSSTLTISSTVLAPTLTLAATPTSSSFGQQIILSATLAPYSNQGLSSNGQAVTFTANGSPLGTGVLNSGVATFNVNALPTGANPVTASYAGDTTLSSASSNVLSFIVGKATPEITWAAAAPINYGSALTNTTLNASASVPGVFTYTPGAGVVPPARDRTLSVSFVPSDTSNYVSSSASNTLVVVQAPLTLTANSSSRSFGTTNPTFTVMSTGVVNNDVITTAASTNANVSSAPGSYAVVPSASGTNAADYKLNIINGTLTITQAKTTTSLISSAPSLISGNSVTYTANVATAVAGTPTGSIQFLNGATVLSTVPLTGLTAAYTTNTLPIGSNSITAVYQGDTNFSASTSPVSAIVVTGAPDFSVTANPSAITIKQGQSATVTLTLTPVNGYNQPTTFACSGLPALAACTFSPAVLTPNNAPATTQLTITTAGPAVASLTGFPIRPDLAHRGIGPILAVAGMLCVLPLGGRRNRRTGLGLFILLVGMSLSSSLGCAGSGSGSTSTGSATPVGASQVTIGASASNSSSHSFALTVTITQ